MRALEVRAVSGAFSGKTWPPNFSSFLSAPTSSVFRLCSAAFHLFPPLTEKLFSFCFLATYQILIIKCPCTKNQHLRSSFSSTLWYFSYKTRMCSALTLRDCRCQSRLLFFFSRWSGLSWPGLALDCTGSGCPKPHERGSCQFHFLSDIPSE